MPVHPAPREDVLTTERASEWLGERGVRGRGPSHLIADEVREPAFRVARVWHTAARLERPPVPGMLFAFVVADGSAEVVTASSSRTVEAGGLVVAPAAGLLGLHVTDRVARFEFEVGIRELSLVAAVSDEVAEGIVADDAAPSFRPVLLATMNAAFNAGLDTASGGFASFRLATTSLLAGLLDDALARRPSGASPREAILHRRALDAIAVHCADPLFSPSALARELNISERHLRRVFESRGGTPASALRSARLQRARALLADPSPPPLAQAARLAGFRSPRAYRRARALEVATG